MFDGVLAMAFAITDSCVACDACTLVCPRHAVIVDQDAYSIQSNLCDECADLVEMPHCLQVCPADCIGPEMGMAAGQDDHSPIAQPYVATNAPLEFPRSRSSRYK